MKEDRLMEWMDRWSARAAWVAIGAATVTIIMPALYRIMGG